MKISDRVRIEANIQKAVQVHNQPGTQDWEESKQKDKEEELTAEDMDYITKM